MDSNTHNADRDTGYAFYMVSCLFISIYLICLWLHYVGLLILNYTRQESFTFACCTSGHKISETVYVWIYIVVHWPVIHL